MERRLGEDQEGSDRAEKIEKEQGQRYEPDQSEGGENLQQSGVERSWRGFQS